MTLMLQRADSTVRTEVLGEELRRLREACGMTLLEVVNRIGFSESQLSRIENGRRVPSPEDVAALLVVYGVTGEQRHDLLTLAKRTDQPGFWQRGRWSESRFTTLKLMESLAMSLVSFEPLMIPGLLQTTPFTQACVKKVQMIDDQQTLDDRVIGRIHRQAVLRKPNGPTLISVIGEPALRCPIGGRAVQRDQLRYLIEVARRENVTLRVMPTAFGAHPGLLGSFLRMRFRLGRAWCSWRTRPPASSWRTTATPPLTTRRLSTCSTWPSAKKTH